MLEHQQFGLVVRLLNCALQVMPNFVQYMPNLVLHSCVNIQSNGAMLEHQQFDLVVRLLNCALQVMPKFKSDHL